MVRHPPAPPGRWKRAAAAKVARRGAATNEACGGADPTTPARSVVGRRGRARAAWGWQCRAAGPAGCRSFPWQSARARRAHEAKRDQDQVVEIPGFQVWETAGNGTAKANRQRFPASGAPGGQDMHRWVHDTFSSRPQIRHPRGFSRKGTSGRAASMGLSVKSEAPDNSSDGRCGWIPVLQIWRPAMSIWLKSGRSLAN